MAGKIFVNYRREDGAATAARVHDRLAGTFGKPNVFMDVDNLLAGQRFDKELERALAACDVFVAVIGNRWVELLRSRSAADERDYVHEEIAAALKRGIVVIPVLIEGAKLPRSADLPEDLREMVLHQKHDILHEYFGRDIESLIMAIRAAHKAMGAEHGGSRALGGRLWRWLPAGVGALGMLGLAWAGMQYMGSGTAPTTPVALIAQRPEPVADTVAIEQEARRRAELAAQSERERQARAIAEAQRQAALAAEVRRASAERQKAAAEAAAKQEAEAAAAKQKADAEAQEAEAAHRAQEVRQRNEDTARREAEAQAKTEVAARPTQTEKVPPNDPHGFLGTWTCRGTGTQKIGENPSWSYTAMGTRRVTKFDGKFYWSTSEAARKFFTGLTVRGTTRSKHWFEGEKLYTTHYWSSDKRARGALNRTMIGQVQGNKITFSAVLTFSSDGQQVVVRETATCVK